MNMHSSLKNWWVLSVLAAGWVVETFIHFAVYPNTEYILYYVVCAELRVCLILYPFIVIYKVGGSLLIWIVSGFSVAAMFMNIMYLDSANYAAINPWRRETFAFYFRAAEIMVLLWSGWHVRGSVHSYLRRFRHRVSVMVYRGNI